MRTLAALCGALAAALAGAAAAGSPDLAITHVTVIDTTGGPTQPDMTVIVRDQRIVEVGKSEVVLPGDWHSTSYHARTVQREDNSGRDTGTPGIYYEPRPRDCASCDSRMLGSDPMDRFVLARVRTR